MIRSVVACAVALLASAATAHADDRIQLHLDTSEADSVLAIVSAHHAGRAVPQSAWDALFATTPYRRLLVRYNEAVAGLNKRGRGEHLALWSPRLLELISP